MYAIESFLEATERIPLLPGPTPLHDLREAHWNKDIRLLIKRDDMTGIGPGGNKVRSLEYILGEAKAKGATEILAAGPEQSNLCVLAAAACARADCPKWRHCSFRTVTRVVYGQSRSRTI